MGVAFGVTRNFRLSATPKSRITPELREGLKEHKNTIACEIMWHDYVVATGQSTEDLPPASPDLRDAYGDPRAFAEALRDYDLVRKYWDLIEKQAEDSCAAALITADGIVLLRESPDGCRGKTMKRAKGAHSTGPKRSLSCRVRKGPLGAARVLRDLVF
jgi:hypothetical protein